MRELGRGGMGVVYEVRDPALPERRLALKLILGGADPDALARFGREVELLARVRHKNVVPVHTIARASEGPYVVMDLVEGESLAKRAARGVSPRDAAALLRDLCDAVMALHAAGIVHRDLKPANVIVRDDGSPVLLDFGVARAATGASLTRTGEIVGSPHYMSPEQAQGKGAVALDERADVYGLGAILFELLAGERPFAEVGGTPFNVLYAVIEREPTWPPGRSVPPALAAICRRAMAKAPAERFQSARDLRIALEAALAQDAVEPARGARRHLVVLLAALVLGAGAVAVAVTPRSVEAPAPIASSVAVVDGPAAVVSERRPPQQRAKVFGSRATLQHPPSSPRLMATRALWLDADRVVTAGGLELRLWDLSREGSEPVSTVPVSIWLKLLALAGDRVVAAGDGLQAFAAADLRPLCDVVALEREDAEVDVLAASPDGETVAFGFNRGQDLRVSRAAALGGQVAAPFSRPSVRALVYAPGGDRLVGAPRGGVDRVLIAWPIAPDGGVGDGVDHPLDAAVTALAFSPDGRDLVAGTTKGSIAIFDVGMEGSLLSVTGGLESFGMDGTIHGEAIIDVAFSPDGALLFTLVEDDDGSTIRVFARSSWLPLTARRTSDEAQHLLPAPDGQRLLVSMRGRVEVWDVPDELRAGKSTR